MHKKEAKSLTLEEALATVDKVLAGRVKETETVAVGKARGRVLAKNATSRLDLPAFDKSAMDGYAVMAGDERESYRVIEVVPAGRVPTKGLASGLATKVMTGAPVPEGAGCVIMVEDTDGGNEAVQVFQHRGKSNICAKGEDVRVGQTVCEAGKKLGAIDVANLIACGVASVAVRARVRVAILATGYEIVGTSEELAPGKIVDSNSPMLEGLARENDLDVALSERVGDDPTELAEAIEKAASGADLVLLSGGVSAGDFDYAPGALRASSFVIHFDSVAMQPGRPLTFATRTDCVALGMPGNPVSVLVAFHIFARRVAALLSGGTPPMRAFDVPLATEVKRKGAERLSLRPCIIRSAGEAEPIEYHGSAHLLAISGADGFFVVPEGVTRIGAGEKVRFYPLALGRW